MDYIAKLKDVKEHIQLYKDAEIAILKGSQDYKIGNRYLRRADLKQVQDKLKELEKEENEILAMLNGGGRMQSIIPRDN